VQYLNIPKQTNDPDGTLWERTYRLLKETSSKLKCMLITILMSEIVVGFSYQDWKMASLFFNFMEKCAAKEERLKWKRLKREWHKIHVVYANMGGFVMKVVHSTSEEDRLGQITEEQKRKSDEIYRYFRFGDHPDYSIFRDMQCVDAVNGQGENSQPHEEDPPQASTATESLGPTRQWRESRTSIYQ